MYTRDSVVRNYTIYNPERVTVPGFVKVTMHKNIPQTWAIKRPSEVDPNGSPFYLGAYRRNEIVHGGVLAVTPAKPHIEMDPSNPQTWQRQYVFT